MSNRGKIANAAIEQREKIMEAQMPGGSRSKHASDVMGGHFKRYGVDSNVKHRNAAITRREPFDLHQYEFSWRSIEGSKSLCGDLPTNVSKSEE
jgi:hypothetical protein